MAKRKIIEIDRDMCNGCGVCTDACDEGALELDEEGKAVLVRDIYCDGMGMCLNVCPTGALKVVERESSEYDAAATREWVRETRGPEAVAAVHPGSGEAAAEEGRQPKVPAPSELSQWPIQLHLISPAAPYFKNADLLIAADCTAFARGSFHADLLRGRRLVIACPKLDDVTPYVDKLTELIREADLKSIAVVMMTVPCCGGLLYMVNRAVAQAGVDLPVRQIRIDPRGEVVEDTTAA